MNTTNAFDNNASLVYLPDLFQSVTLRKGMEECKNKEKSSAKWELAHSYMVSMATIMFINFVPTNFAQVSRFYL